MAKAAKTQSVNERKTPTPKKTSEGNSKMTVFKSKDDKRNRKHYVGQGR